MFSPANKQISLLTDKLNSMSGNVSGKLVDEIIPLYRVIDPISGKIAELVSLQIAVAGEERQSAIELYSTSIKLFILFTVIAVITSAGLNVWVRKSVMTPINDILQKLHIIKKKL